MSPDNETDIFWREYIKNHPSQKEIIDEAIYLINSIKVVEPTLERGKLDILEARIFAIQSTKQKNTRTIAYFRWAAIFFALVALAGVAYQILNRSQVDLATVEIPDSDKAEIIFADGSKRAINSENSEIIQENSETLIVDSDTLLLKKESVINHSELVTVVMPYGKQTRLQLSDGSVIHINSGSKVSYPVQFYGDKRTVYLSGEAYFKVAPNKEKPFVVHTNDLDVRVTGTEFNVSSYPDDSFAQTVLVSGAVTIDRKNILKRNVELRPGESLFLDKSSGEISTGFVNTSLYISWINGYIICEKEPIKEVVKKLERFYNCSVICRENVTGITFSGKLDLKENIESVIEALSFASPMDININNSVLN